jgi:hypothetical protein
MAGRKKLMLEEGVSERMENFASTFCIAYAKNVKKCKAIEIAARSIGLNARQGQHWIRQKLVKQSIERRLKAVAVKYGKTADDVLDELVSIGFSRIGDYFDQDQEGTLKLKQLKDMGDKDKAIKKIKHDQDIKEIGGEDNPIKVTTNHYEYELYDKLGALKVLAEFHKIIGKGEGGGGQKPSIVLMLPDNGARPKQLPTYAEFEEIL